MALSRRKLLGGVGAAAGLTALSACTRALPQRRPADAPLLSLPAPRVAQHLVIREIAGPRPFRRQGFRVEAERLGDKWLIHHYGHGGCGITLSWGTARMALEHALQQPQRDAAVIGCGAVGLATARLFQDHGFRVTIYARELPPDTVSNIAGGLFAPSYLVEPEYRTEDFGAVMAPALRYAHRRFQVMPYGRFGIRWVPLYMLSHRDIMPLGWEWAQTPELFLAHAHPPGTHPFGDRFAHEFQVMIIEPSTYLPAMMQDVRMAGGTIVVRDFDTPGALTALPEPVIVNCTGLGAQSLFGDDDLLPIKGQLSVIRPQPEIDYGVIEGGTGLYMFPRGDGLQLGGSAERGDASTHPDPVHSQRILSGHQRLFAFRA